MSFSYKIALLSESALTVSFEQIIDEQINDFVLLLHHQLTQNSFHGFIESVPAYASLTIYFDLWKIKKKTQQTAEVFVAEYVEKIVDGISIESIELNKKGVVEIPVIYDGEDLLHVCQLTGLSAVELIKLHTEPLYRVYMLGFLPGFAYLGGMDKRLAVLRRDSPRLKVPAGSVGIAGEQTGVYPVESPGGWQIIGRTVTKLFQADETQLTLLKQGDYVRFIEVV